MITEILLAGALVFALASRVTVRAAGHVEAEPTRRRRRPRAPLARLSAAEAHWLAALVRAWSVDDRAREALCEKFGLPWRTLRRASRGQGVGEEAVRRVRAEMAKRQGGA